MDRRTTRVVLRLGAVALVAIVYWASQWRDSARPPASTVGRPNSGPTVEQAFAQHLSDVMVYVDGEVDRVLSDDREGSRHQRFIVETSSATTVLVAHNIDLADRVPLDVGDRVEVFGEYEWNERGGVLHWTHHDPQQRRPGGWIRHQGRKYR